MSFTVGTPNCASANVSGVSARSTAALPISPPTGTPVRATMRWTTGYASGCTADASSGLSPFMILRKPAAC